MQKFNLGWIKDKNGDKFAPKTLISQVIERDNTTLEDILKEKVSSPINAEVGQQLVVKEVDENGKPIEWEYSEYVKPEALNDYVKTTDCATSSQPGLVRTNTSYGTTMSGQYIQTYAATTSDITSKSNNYRPLTPKNIDYIVKTGFANSSLIWNEEEKAKARSTIGVMQNNWEQYDENAADFIKNRTHYHLSINVNVEQTVCYCDIRYANTNYTNINEDWHKLLIDKITEGTLVDGYNIVYDSETSDLIVYKVKYGCYFNVKKTEPKANIVDNNYVSNTILQKNCSCHYSKTNIKLLDEKYIPDTISRKKDVLELIKETNNESVYKGKFVSILGDSISTFEGYIPSDNAVYYTGSNAGVRSVEDTWWKKLINALDMELYINNSWSGSRVTTTNGDASAGCMSRCENLGDTPDVIIVYLGINDFNNDVAIGSYNGTGTFPTNTTTFREAYAIMLNKILSKYSSAEVWVCTLPYCERNGNISFPETNDNGTLLKEYNDAIRELANLFNVKVLEHAKCGLTYHNMHIYMGDYSSGSGLHPNAYGHSLIANNDICQMDNYIRTRYAITEDDNEKDILSISATYTGGNVEAGTDVNNLNGITVTALYSDGNTKEITDYILNGVIEEGENIIIVTYKNKTTSFIINGIITWKSLNYTEIKGFYDGAGNLNLNYPTVYCTGLVEVGDIKRVRFTQTNTSTHYTTFFDSNQTFIKYVKTTEAKTHIVSFPDNAAYFSTAYYDEERDTFDIRVSTLAN